MSEPTVGDLQAQRAKAKSRSLLPSPPPAPGAPAGELAAWLTAALGLGADPVVGVTRFGRDAEARLVVNLRSGERVTFERSADVFHADMLARGVILRTSAVVPPYQRGDVHHLASAIVRLADVAADTDDRDEARDWGSTFLDDAQPLTGHNMSTPTGRYAALCALRDHRSAEPEYAATPAERSAVVVDATGERLVRCTDFVAHVRALVVRPLPERTLYSRMTEVGWEHAGRLQQRQPQGHLTARVRALVVPAAWDTDL